MKRRALAGAAAALLLAASLGGCLGAAPPVPRDNFYRIMVTPPQPAEAPLFAGIVSVAPLDADGLLRERPILFSSSGGPQKIQQHDYHYWIEPPARMLQAQLVDYLRGSAMADSVVTPELRLAADYEISGKIKRMERLLGSGPARVVAELELAMVETRTRRLIVVGTYSAEVPTADGDVASSVLALDEALSDIFSRFTAEAGGRYMALRTAGSN